MFCILQWLAGNRYSGTSFPGTQFPYLSLLALRYYGATRTLTWQCPAYKNHLLNSRKLQKFFTNFVDSATRAVCLSISNSADLRLKQMLRIVLSLTLRTMCFGDALLNGMQFGFCASNAFNSCHRHTVYSTNRRQTCIHGYMLNFMRSTIDHFRKHHRTCSTTAFSASQLCSTQPQRVTQISQQRTFRVWILFNYLKETTKEFNIE